MLGALALGVSSLLLIRGHRVTNIEPKPKAVMDLKVSELIATASNLRLNEQLLAATNLLIGSTVSAHTPQPDWVPEKLTNKLDAGAQFLNVHPNMDVEVLRSYMGHMIAKDLTHRASIIAGTVILTSADDARWLRDHRANITIPDSVVQRLENAADPRAEGLSICAEHLSQLAKIPGVSGAHIIASTDLAMIPAAIDAADLDPD